MLHWVTFVQQVAMHLSLTGIQFSLVQGACTVDPPVASPALLQRIAIADPGDTIHIPHDLTTEAVSIALHAGLKLRGEPRPCHESPGCSDEALPGPCKGLDLPEVRAQEGRVSAFQISTPHATSSSISHLSLRHNGGPCDHEGPANTWGLSLEEAAEAIEARAAAARQSVQDLDAVPVHPSTAASRVDDLLDDPPRAVAEQAQRVEKTLNDLTEAGMLPPPLHTIVL